MATPPNQRSVKISEDERGGWSSDRPRRGGPPREADVSVRCRVLKPDADMRYSPGSLLVLVSGSADERDRFATRVLESPGLVLSLDKVRGLLTGKGVAEEVAAEKGAELLGAAVAKRLEANETVVLAADGLDAGERERYVRMAAKLRRPRHLILIEAPRDQISEDDLEPLNALRRELDAGGLGAEGFHTALRLGGGTINELKRLVFRPPPEDE